MKIETFNAICDKFGDQSYDSADRWKSIKYISTEGQMEPIDFEFMFNTNQAYFINDETMGTGFIYIETPYAEFEPINNIKINSPEHRRIVTFIGLEMVNGLSFRTKSVDDTNTIITNAENS